MTTPLRFTSTETAEGTPVLKVSGEIDMSNSDDFNHELRGALAHRTTETPLLVDLTAVDYLDSAALAVLFEHVASITVDTNKMLEPILRICGLSDIVPVRVIR
ncbi:STAS domain-containing protein [Actinosynnema sp. NPDC020468]|uniref:STAS domain-containing protein n=1 Tax=Actinosynnema sp. NPDC020468 TaxID=3154488 RepID=UPI0033F91C3A